MNILILNGSPTGDGSITLQTMLYIQKLFPGHEYHVINVSQKIKRIEKDFAPSREALEAAELIVFCYPVYTFLVPAQLHRFIELMKAEDLDLSGKYATQVSTSKHFYDTTAHEFIRENCADLGLRYIPGLSADMEDLLRKKGQREAEAFFRHVLWAVENDSFERVLLPSPKAPFLQGTRMLFLRQRNRWCIKGSSLRGRNEIFLCEFPGLLLPSCRRHCNT